MAPISAAIATERAKGAGMAIGWMKDDMAVPFLFLQPRLSLAPRPEKENIADIDNGLRVEDEGMFRRLTRWNWASSQGWFNPGRPEALTATAD